MQSNRLRNTDRWPFDLCCGFNGVLFIELKTEKKKVKLPIVTVFGAVVERIYKLTKSKINGQIECIQIVFPKESSALKEKICQIKAKVGIEVFH
uniref:Uncharacterized protein n=1 Tax=Panagrellus redivivus TaxID=6233 RepID=A0A7E4URB7_PANRE